MHQKKRFSLWKLLKLPPPGSCTRLAWGRCTAVSFSSHRTTTGRKLGQPRVSERYAANRTMVVIRPCAKEL